MKIILLAAGKGTRIRKEINDVPKSTLEIEKNLPLIRYTVELLLKNNIEVSIVVGFKKELVIDTIKDLPVTIYYNPFYDVTNSIASLWFARDFWNEGEDILIMNADVYIEQDTLDLLLNETRCPAMLADSRKTVEGDFFFKYGEDYILKDYGKELTVENRNGEYVGIAKLTESFRSTFLNKLNQMIGKQKHGKWWENVLYTLSEEDRQVHVCDIGDRFWSEIDKIEDYHTILNYKTSLSREN